MITPTVVLVTLSAMGIIFISKNHPTASYGVSKTPRNEASFGEYTRRDLRE